MAEVARRDFDARRAARERGQRIDRKRMLRKDGGIAGRRNVFGGELEDVVAAVAQHEAARNVKRLASASLR